MNYKLNVWFDSTRAVTGHGPDEYHTVGVEIILVKDGKRTILSDTFVSTVILSEAEAIAKVDELNAEIATNPLQALKKWVALAS